MNQFLFTVTLLLSQLSTNLFAEAKHGGGFSMEIFHRDSKVSPFYNPSSTTQELAVKAALHSAARANGFASILNGSKIVSTVTKEGIEYQIKVSFGSPPVESYGVVDTGSDLVWIQCKPCKNCFRQPSPVFDPTKSSTYTNLPCSDKLCSPNPFYKCGTNKRCLYTASYLSTETTNGVMGKDTMTLYSTTGQAYPFPNTVFGCGNDNDVQVEGKAVGVFGFALAERSFIGQLGNRIQNKFSYCLLAKTQATTSKIKFGADAVLSGPGVATTPLMRRPGVPLFIVDFDAVTVGNERIKYTVPRNGPGNIILDSGTTVTLLIKSFYNEVEAAVKKAIPLRPAISLLPEYTLCYAASAFSNLPDLKFVFHFKGADVALKNYNTFFDVGSQKCLAMQADDKLNIYGSNSQINFQVSHDFTNNKISFAPADCAKI